MNIERKIRRMFPAIRFFQAYLPLGMANRIIRFGLEHVRLPDDIDQEDVMAGGVPCIWIIPSNIGEDHVLLYLHGGGFVYGLTPQHVHMVAYLAHKMGIRALIVDYRLGPVHPFPAALDDCVVAYQWLLNRKVPANHIVLAGDSAGGNLTITTLMKLRDSGMKLPAAGACLSPVVDLTTRKGEVEQVNDPMLHPRGMRLFNISYVGDNDAHNPLISPAMGDWHGLPPLLIHSGEDETLKRDALKAEELAQEAGVDVRVEIYPRMWHVWQIYLALPQATQSLDDIAGFLKGHMGD